MSITFDNIGIKYVYIKNFFKKTTMSSVLQMRSVSYPRLFINNFDNDNYEMYSLNMFNSSFSYYRNNVSIEHTILRQPTFSINN